MNSFRFGTNHCYPINGTPSFNCYDSAASMPSTNADNTTNNWAHYTAATNGATTTLTFQTTRTFLSCFEYRVNGSLPNVAGSNPNKNLPDGRWSFKCVSSTGTPTATVDIEDADLIEVRLAFGAEDTERFNWEVVPQT